MTTSDRNRTESGLIPIGNEMYLAQRSGCRYMSFRRQASNPIHAARGRPDSANLVTSAARVYESPNGTNIPGGLSCDSIRADTTVGSTTTSTT